VLPELQESDLVALTAPEMKSPPEHDTVSILHALAGNLLIF